MSVYRYLSCKKREVGLYYCSTPLINWTVCNKIKSTNKVVVLELAFIQPQPYITLSYSLVEMKFFMAMKPYKGTNI